MLRKTTEKKLCENRCSGNKKSRQNHMRTDAPKNKKKKIYEKDAQKNPRKKTI
jgi:hypothetical protein